MMTLGLTWGDKGCVYDRSKCTHAETDGCMWCTPNSATASSPEVRCRGCGTVTDHHESECDDCAVAIVLDGIEDMPVTVVTLPRVGNYIAGIIATVRGGEHDGGMADGPHPASDN